MTTPRSPSSFSGSPCIICAAASRITLKLPMRLTLMTLVNASSGSGPLRPTTRPASATPAQLTSTCGTPTALTASAMARSADSASVTSQTTAQASPPISAACFFSASALVSRSATRAPRPAR